MKNIVIAISIELVVNDNFDSDDAEIIVQKIKKNLLIKEKNINLLNCDLVELIEIDE